MKMRDIKYYIVLRDKNNALVTWKGYETFTDCVEDFTELYKTYNDISEGGFHYEVNKGHLSFTDGRDRVNIETANGGLLMEILFDNSRGNEEIFDNFFADKRSLA